MLNEITLLPGEQRELILINEPNADWHVVQQKGSSLRVHVLFLSDTQGDEQWQSTITIEQNDTDCRTEIYAMGMLQQTQQARLRTCVHHNIGGGYSSQTIKFVLNDRAKASFRGELKILPDAQHVEAYQTNRNILLSRQADMVTEPQLEIYADDVKASHGATTGQLDESALFYMQQRCIGREAARKLLLCAFFDDVMRTLPDEQMQENLLDKINEYIG